MRVDRHSSRVVHLQWAGPYTWEEKDKLSNSEDFGVYQIYGCHSIYGVDVLLYIGKASSQTFAGRLSQQWHWLGHQDPQRITVYVGRCSGWKGTPSNEKWEEEIDLAEKLLILATKPAHNAKKGIDRDALVCVAFIFSIGATTEVCLRKYRDAVIHPNLTRILITKPIVQNHPDLTLKISVSHLTT
jgi:hypothetical protein